MLVRHVTPLYTPPELTQKAPNKAPVSKELTVESIAPRPVAEGARARACREAGITGRSGALAPPPPPSIAQASRSRW